MSSRAEEHLQGIFEAPLTNDGVAAILEELHERGDGEALAGQLCALLQKFSVLVEVTRTVSGSLSLDKLLPRLVATITEVLEADRGTLFLHDPESDELFSRVLQGGAVSEIRVPSHAGIAGTVFAEGETLNIEDAYADSRFNPEVDRRTGYRTRNILCVPLRNRDGDIIGVTQVLNKTEGAFTGSDAALLQAITTHAAAALEHARLFERLEEAHRDEAMLLEVTSAISSDLDLNSLLSKVMNSTTKLLQAERSTLFIHDPETNELWSRVAEGIGSKEIRFPAGAGIAGSVFTTRETLNIPDAYADKRFNPEVDRRSGFTTRSILCMPVVDKSGQPLAVMQVLNKIGGPFSSRDEDRLHAFSAEVAVALENAKLFQNVLHLKNYNEGILKSLSNGVVTLDTDFTVGKVNDAAARILAVEDSALLGRTAADVFEKANPWVVSSLDYVAEHKSNDYHADRDLERADGRRISVNLTAAPLMDIEQTIIGYMLVIEDITNEKRTRNTMARYIAKEVLDKLLEAGEEPFAGSSQTATVLFSDIRHFTSIAERIGPGDTVAMLNEYFSEMVEIILRHNGVLDKYIGDAIMAVFGAPQVGSNDADNAVSVAIEMIQTLRELNRRREASGMAALEIGIGISTGEVIAGNIGSAKRMDYTVIGDSVNLAARLEGANKVFGTNILVSASTVEAMRSNRAMREVDLIRVKGKDVPIAVYEPLDYHDAAYRDSLEQVAQAYQDGLRSYHARKWEDAIENFRTILEHCPDDGPSRQYFERCRHYRESPPDDNWDGVWSLTHK